MRFMGYEIVEKSDAVFAQEVAAYHRRLSLWEQDFAKQTLAYEKKVPLWEAELKEWKKKREEMKASGFPFQIKTTLISTTVTLLGQWYDEIKKFAPGLIVKVAHVSFKNHEDYVDPNTFKYVLPKERARAKKAKAKRSFYRLKRETVDLRDVDILLTVATTPLSGGLGTYKAQPGRGSWGDTRITSQNVVKFYRSIADEAHKYGFATYSRSYGSKSIPCERMWGVTGTPVTSKLRPLLKVVDAVGHGKEHGGGLRLDREITAQENAKCLRPTFVAKLRRLMIRHTKAQRIHGRAALALPTLECDTVWLEMTAQERQGYKRARAEDAERRGRVLQRAAQGTHIASLTMRMALKHSTQFLGCAETKQRAIVDDLVALRKLEPHMHAVVFSNHTVVHAALLQRVKKRAELRGVNVYEISGSVKVSERHTVIKTFQKGEQKPKLLLCMIRTAACGITLTAATRVYLAEPCLDPATEVQAAGRIHRLGQSKEVLCRRFCFRDSVESCVVAVHAKLKAGTFKITDKAFSHEAVKMLCKE